MPNIRVQANGEAVPSPAHFSVLKMRRTVLEAYIEEMIALLDHLDGDEDLEPYLADTLPSDDDLEEDDEREPEETDEDGDEQDCCHSEDEWSPYDATGLHFDGHGVKLANDLIRDLPTFNDRPTMKALIAAGWDPERSEIDRIRRASKDRGGR